MQYDHVYVVVRSDGSCHASIYADKEERQLIRWDVYASLGQLQEILEKGKMSLREIQKIKEAHHE